MDTDVELPAASGSVEGRITRRITARDIVATFIAYYWRNDPKIEVPGTFLVALLADFGIAAPNTRATLRRLERDQLVITRRAGRNLFFRAAPIARTRAEPGVHRILNFGLSDEWSGVWTVVAFSIPEQHSRIRMALRDSLRLEGFAPFYDGVWIAPGDLREVAVRKAEVRGVEQLSAHLVEDSSFLLRGRRPIESWDLGSINVGYATVRDEATELLQEFSDGTLSPSAALVRRTLLLTRYRRLVPMDPGLPVDMMPAGWLRKDARDAVASAFDALGPLAGFRFDHMLAGVDESWADRVRPTATLTLDELAGISPGRDEELGA
ncbi:PaaX family transcriptional regulator C-terminal domain-containing protein [Microbacterium sp. A93]|uniref:PaaX family transcriptional regulator C-terminal domain-containing protein n=1 Tax=Microbacterium sp. A93 TaxID=3450716 RepID=UPI003F41E9CA